MFYCTFFYILFSLNMKMYLLEYILYYKYIKYITVKDVILLKIKYLD